MEKLEINHSLSAKLGNSQDECEDAIYCRSKDGNVYVVRAAIADGATTSIFSKEWANLLAKQFTQDSSTSIASLKANVETSAETWHKHIDSLSLPWHATAKAQQGAFASLLGVELRAKGSVGQWKAIAVGDSCLFHIRNNKILFSFPITRAELLTNNPTLLSSKLSANNEAWQAVQFAKGRWQPEDQLLLATDGLSDWIIRQSENGLEPWKILANRDKENFPKWADEQRLAGKIKNDDLAFLLIKTRTR